MKAKRINYKILVKCSPLLALLLCVGVWQLALKKTWESYQKYLLLQDAVIQSSELTISPGYTADRAQFIGSVYHRFEVDTMLWKNRLWNYCATLSQKNKLLVKAFPSWINVHLGNTGGLNQKIEFTGNFHDLLRMQRELDTISAVGRITGLSYKRASRDTQTTLILILTGIPVKKGHHNE